MLHARKDGARAGLHHGGGALGERRAWALKRLASALCLLTPRAALSFRAASLTCSAAGRTASHHSLLRGSYLILVTCLHALLHTLLVLLQAILRAIFGYFMAIPLEKIPRLDIPLHTLIGEPRSVHCTTCDMHFL
jgi:hypothetical protein